MGSKSDQVGIWHTTVDASGRVFLPSQLRHELHATKGTMLSWVRSGNGIELKSFEQSISEIQAYYQSLAPAEDIWSEALIKERRVEATRE